MKLTNAQKRVRIARDVIAAIHSKRINPQHGCYFVGYTIKEAAKQNLGAALVAHIDRFNYSTNRPTAS